MINEVSPIIKTDKCQPKPARRRKRVSVNPDKRTPEIRVTIPIGNIYGININKTKLATPLQQIAYQITKGKGAKFDGWTDYNTYYGCERPDKKWVYAKPSDALKRSLEDAFNSNLTLAYGNNIPQNLPEKIETPDYGHNWGRHANYIEINNRAIANMDGNRTNSAILNTIKLLPLIPPSHDKWANCLLISQLFPNIWGDGWNNNGENSIYGIKLENERLSDNIGYEKIGDKYFTPEEQVRAFNDLAHLRGFKTSFRMLVSEDQIKLGDSGQFRWSDPSHVEAFIIACCKGIDLGFDGIFFDSVKHVGNYDMGNYAGVGAVPTNDQMAYILDEIRKRTGKFDLAFSGEKAEYNTSRYKNMGLDAGASSMDPDNIENILNSSVEQKDSPVFAWGPTVSDDNDENWFNYDQRTGRVISCLYGYYNAEDKIPTFMQMNDLFPLNHDINTHKLMMENINFSDNNDPNTHFNRLFADDKEANEYRDRINWEFANCYKYYGKR